MKKLRLLSLILASLMVLSLVPALFVTTASAATTLPAQPTVLPDGKEITNTKLWVDWDKAGELNADGKAFGKVTTDGFIQVVTPDKLMGLQTSPTTTAWRGAEGLMFYVDASEATSTFVDFQINLYVANRLDSSNESKAVQFWGTPCYYNNGPTYLGDDLVSTAYYYGGANWNSFTTSKALTTSAYKYYPRYDQKASGWYYLPFSSMFCAGAAGSRLTSDTSVGMAFTEFMEKFQDQTLGTLQVKSNGKSLKFGDMYFVYSASDYEVGATVDLTSKLTGTNFEGTYTTKPTYANGVLTANKMSTITATNLMWLKSGSTLDNFKTATGLRFHVDTTGLGGAQLQLRVRMINEGETSAVTGLFNTKANTNTYSQATTWKQYLCRQGNSVAYYFENGEAKPLNLATVSKMTTGDTAEDAFAALPVNYVGDIYIPLDSFWLSSDSRYGGTLMIPWATAIAAAGKGPSQICFASTITGTQNTSDANYTDAVTYSNIELVYPELAITGANITLTENFDLNFFAKADATVTDLALTYSFNNETAKNWTLTANGTEQKFSYTDILPQEIGDNMVVTLSGKINGVAVKQVVNYSILQYCKNKITAAENSELAALLKAVLNYGANAQTVANYKTDALVNKGYEDTTVVTNKTVTNAKNALTNDAAKVNDYHFTGAAARLESSLALRLNMSFASAEGVTVEINGAAVPFTAAGAANAYTLVWEGINANGYDEKITAVIKVNGTAVQTLTYSINAYLANVTADSYSTTTEMKALANSIYNYGVAAAAYSATLASLGK